MPLEDAFNDHNLVLLQRADTLLYGGKWFKENWASWSAVIEDATQNERDHEIARRVLGTEAVVISDSLAIDPSDPWATLDAVKHDPVLVHRLRRDRDRETSAPTMKTKRSASTRTSYSCEHAPSALADVVTTDLVAEAQRYVADGSVADLAMGLRKARAILAVAEIYLEEERLLRDAECAATAPFGPPATRWATEEDISTHTGISLATIRSWRRVGAVRVLPFHKVGRLIRYDLNEVDDAIRATRVLPD